MSGPWPLGPLAPGPGVALCLQCDHRHCAPSPTAAVSDVPLHRLCLRSTSGGLLHTSWSWPKGLPHFHGDIHCLNPVKGMNNKAVRTEYCQKASCKQISCKNVFFNQLTCSTQKCTWWQSCCRLLIWFPTMVVTWCPIYARHGLPSANMSSCTRRKRLCLLHFYPACGCAI